MKKSVLISFILIILFSLNLVYAADETRVDKAYACLETQMGENCGNTQSVQQVSFNLLATAYNSNLQNNCKDLLMDKKKDDCWGETATNSCDLKSTALSVLSLANINENIEDYVKWLLKKRKLTTGLTWYLEIDANNKTECEINGKKFTILENKKISGQDPPGLVKAYGGYWFKITDLNRNFTISCDRDFISVLAFQRIGSSTYYISSETHSAPAHDSTIEKVSAYCFANSGDCDYEGSLWTVLALAKAGEEITPYVPYLITMNEPVNKRYLPSAFLYMLYSSVDDYYSDLVSRQKQGKFWDESGNRYYDTALALLALQKVDTDEVRNTKEYLLDLQDSSGCWGSNTAFLLFAGWPRESSYSSKPTESSRTRCEDFSHYCVSAGECALNNTLNNFYCSALSDVCCETKPRELTCSEKGGFTCPENQICAGAETIAQDTNNCCLASCQDVSEESECESLGYSCQDSCNTKTEIEKTNECKDNMVCCDKKPVTAKKSNWWIILILIILIILIILAIIFRNQIKLWWFKRKSDLKTGKGPPPTSRPGMRPMPPYRPMPGQLRPGMRPPLRRPASPSERDKDLEETMKKLREMSK
jgi:hypothetical protein